MALVVAALLLRRLTNGRFGLDRVVRRRSPSSPARCVAAVVSAAFGPTALRLGGIITTGRARRRLPHLDAGRRVRRARRRAGDAHVGRRRRARHPPARPRRGRRRCSSSCWRSPSCPRSATFPTSCSPRSCGRRCASGLAARRRRSSSSARSPSGRPPQNDGPFVRESLTDSLLATQLFIAISAVTSLLLAAVTAERTRAARALAATRRRSARSPASRRRCAGSPRWWPATRRRAASSSR